MNELLTKPCNNSYCIKGVDSAVLGIHACRTCHGTGTTFTICEMLVPKCSSPAVLDFQVAPGTRLKLCVSCAEVMNG